MDYGVPPMVLLNGVPAGIAGTRYTLELMRALARQGVDRVRDTAVKVTRWLPQKDWISEVCTLYNYVKNEIRYVGDMDGIETLHTVDKIMSNQAGDCDDKAILLAAMLKSLNHGARFHAIALVNPNQFEHVFVEAQPHHSGPWIPLDPTVMDRTCGWSPVMERKPVKSIFVEV